MKELASSGSQWRLAIVDGTSDQARARFAEFFAASIRNPNTRQAYYRSVASFLTWAQLNGLQNLNAVEPVHVAAWVELLTQQYATASVKLNLAALKMFFNWMVVGQIVRFNPAASVKSPRMVIRKGKTPVLSPEEARHIINSIDTSKIVGLRDRALIGMMIYSFARVGAALSMRVEDVYVQNRRLWLRLHEKGGKLHDMPCHHELEDWLDEYMIAGDLRADPSGWLFRSICRSSKKLSQSQLYKANAHAMVKRRVVLAGLSHSISNHSFRATGITAYLLSGGTIERAAKMANHASTRTTQLYDRRDDAVVLAEVERIRI